MAKKPYKIEEAKQERTIIFRIPNVFYELLTRLSGKNKQSVNAYSKDKLMEYIYGDPNIKDYPVKLYEEIHELQDKIKGEMESYVFLTQKFIVQSYILENEIGEIKTDKVRTEYELRRKFEVFKSKINQIEQITGEKETKFNIDVIAEIEKQEELLEKSYGAPPKEGDEV